MSQSKTLKKSKAKKKLAQQSKPVSHQLSQVLQSIQNKHILKRDDGEEEQAVEELMESVDLTDSIMSEVIPPIHPHELKFLKQTLKMADETINGVHNNPMSMDQIVQMRKLYLKLQASQIKMTEAISSKLPTTQIAHNQASGLMQEEEKKQTDDEQKKQHNSGEKRDMTSSVERDSLTGQNSQSTVSNSVNLLRQPISLRDSRFAKDLEAISLNGGLGYLERLRDENFGLGMGVAFSCSSDMQEVTQTTDSAINFESRIRDQKADADQSWEDSLDEDTGKGKRKKNEFAQMNQTSNHLKQTKIEEIHDNDGLKMNQTIVSFEKSQLQSQFAGNQPLGSNSYNILSDELIEERFKKIDGSMWKEQIQSYGDIFRNGSGFADEYDLIQEQVRLRKRDYLSKFKQRKMIIKKNKSDLKFKDLNKMSQKEQLQFEQSLSSDEEESRSGDEFIGDVQDYSYSRYTNGLKQRGINQRDLKVLNKHNLKTQRARDEQEEEDLSSMLIEQRNSRGIRLRNEELKIGEDHVYFHDINNNTPLDYYDIFNRNMSILSSSNLGSHQLVGGAIEDQTFVNSSGQKRINQNIFQSDNISEGEEPNNFARNNNDISYDVGIKYSQDGEEIKENANATTFQNEDKAMIHDDGNEKFNDAFTDYDDGSENLHILDKIVADFNNSSSRFLYDSQNQINGPKPKTVPFRTQKMPQSFLESNLFYPDLYENYIPTFEEMADRRFVNQRRKNLHQQAFSGLNEQASLYEQFIEENSQNYHPRGESEQNDEQKDYAFQLGYKKGQEVAEEMMRKVQQDEAEMQEIINQIKYQEEPFIDMIKDIDDNHKFASYPINNYESNFKQHKSKEPKAIDSSISKEFKFSGVDFQAIDDMLNNLELEEQKQIALASSQQKNKKQSKYMQFDYSAVANQLSQMENDGWNNETLLKILGIGDSAQSESETDKELKLMLEQEEQMRLRDKLHQQQNTNLSTFEQEQSDSQEVEEEIKFYLNSDEKYERAVQAFKELIDQQKAIPFKGQEKPQQLGMKAPKIQDKPKFTEVTQTQAKVRQVEQNENEQDKITYTQNTEKELPIIEQNLKRLQNFIKGDLFHCAICSSAYDAFQNLPRVLFCGDCLCEGCIRDAILPISEQQQQQQASTAHISRNDKQRCPLGKMLKCWICDAVHHFKLRDDGFIICNDNYINVSDEQGIINVTPDLSKQLEDYEIEEIPNDLILRSIPVNEELMESMKEKDVKSRSYNMLQHISQYVQIDKLNKNQARNYLQELCSIVDSKDVDFTLQLEGEEINASELMSSDIYNPNERAGGNHMQQLRELEDSLERPIEIEESKEPNNKRRKLIENALTQALIAQGYTSKDIEKLGNELIQSKDSAQILAQALAQSTSAKKSTQKQLQKQLQMQSSSTLAHLNNQTTSKLQQTAQRLAALSQNQQYNQPLKGSNSSAPIPLLKTKIDPFEDFNVRNHFGPSNNAYAKIFDDFKTKDSPLKLEEGLDEREPEKAICPDTLSQEQNPVKNINHLQQVIGKQTSQLKQQPKSEAGPGIQQNPGDANSANKKNKRKKKKRQKARQQKQEQKIQFKNGFQIDETIETDLYSMLVPPEEFQGSSNKNAGDIQKQQLRNPFHEQLPNENFYQLRSLQDQYQGLKDNQLNFSLLCEQCSSDFVLAPDALSMNYLSSQQIQIPKLQSQMKKELLESGILTIISHQCLDCKSQNQIGATAQQPIQLSMCLFCALLHKQKHPQHHLKQVLQKQTLQSLTKRSQVFELLLNSAFNERVRYQVDNEISKLLATMRAIFKLPVSLLQVQNPPNQIPQIFQQQAQTNSQFIHQATH